MDLVPLRFLEDGVSAKSTEEHGGGYRDLNVQHGRTHTKRNRQPDPPDRLRLWLREHVGSQPLAR